MLIYLWKKVIHIHIICRESLEMDIMSSKDTDIACWFCKDPHNYFSTWKNKHINNLDSLLIYTPRHQEEADP